MPSIVVTPSPRDSRWRQVVTCGPTIGTAAVVLDLEREAPAVGAVPWLHFAGPVDVCLGSEGTTPVCDPPTCPAAPGGVSAGEVADILLVRPVCRLSPLGVACTHVKSGQAELLSDVRAECVPRVARGANACERRPAREHQVDPLGVGGMPTVCLVWLTCYPAHRAFLALVGSRGVPPMGDSFVRRHAV